jgi:hypothetical protein
MCRIVIRCVVGSTLDSFLRFLCIVTMGFSRRRTSFLLLLLLRCPCRHAVSALQQLQSNIASQMHPNKAGSPQPSFPSSSQTLFLNISSPRWVVRLKQLEAYYIKHGHTAVRKQDDPALYQWTCNLRANYRHQVEGRVSDTRRPTLSHRKLMALSSLDFVWNVQDFRWKQRYQELQEFAAQYNHTQVPVASALGVWTQNQRREYRRMQRGVNSTMTTERVEALNELQFQWAVSHDDAWSRRYQELLAFVKEHSHANVPEDYSKNQALGQWVMNQRVAYRRYLEGESTALTAEKTELLEELGFCWTYRQDKWHEMMLRLVTYYEEHGHMQIATTDLPNSDLRHWLNLQRYYYNLRSAGMSSPMTQERVEALESEIPNFPWKGRRRSAPTKRDWSRLFDAMRDKGLSAKLKPKSHWFEGINPLTVPVKDKWTDEDLIALWNSGNDDD